MALSGQNSHIEDYYDTLGIARTASQEEASRPYADIKIPEFQLLSDAIQKGEEQPQADVIYIEPHINNFRFFTTLSPIFNANKRGVAGASEEVLLLDGPFDLESVKANQETIFRRLFFCGVLTRDYSVLLSAASQNALNDAYRVLSNPEKRKQYDALLDSYFKEINDCIKRKDISHLRVLIDRGRSTEFTERPSLGFRVTNEKGQRIEESLAQEKDKEGLKLLADHFREDFSVYKLALMGVDLEVIDKERSIEKNLTGPDLDLTGAAHRKKWGLIVTRYARGNHVAQVNKIIARYPSLSAHALLGYVIYGNAAEIERMLTLKGGSPPDMRASFLMDGLLDYVKNPSQLTRFLASLSPQCSSAIVNIAGSCSDGLLAVASRGKITDKQRALVKNIKFYEQVAAQCRTSTTLLSDEEEAEEPAIKNEPPGAAPATTVQTGGKKPSQPGGSLNKKVQFLQNLTQIFDDSIAAVNALSVPVEDQIIKNDFTEALTALKTKTITDYLNNSFKDPQSALTLAQATQTLVQNLKNPATRHSAIQTFEETTSPFKTSWDWKMILGAVIGFALGFVAGAFLGVFAPPAGVVAALGAGAAGAWIGATLFGAAGAFMGGRLARRRDPDLLQQVVKTGTVLRGALS